MYTYTSFGKPPEITRRSSFLFFIHQFEYFTFLSVLKGVLLICSAQYTSTKNVYRPAYIPLDRNEGKSIIVYYYC